MYRRRRVGNIEINFIEKNKIEWNNKNCDPLGGKGIKRGTEIYGFHKNRPFLDQITQGFSPSSIVSRL